MTEEEAKTKWCALGRKPIAILSGTIQQNCIASGCMMWRWHVRPGEYMRTDYPNDAINDSHPVSGDGYCGLAGKP